ncbi:MAG: hypothetical protein LBI39_02360 [Puniceicoccales bacterium]|nr:hypothetical protein [Puniceicoccales bacterium]
MSIGLGFIGSFRATALQAELGKLVGKVETTATGLGHAKAVTTGSAIGGGAESKTEKLLDLGKALSAGIVGGVDDKFGSVKTSAGQKLLFLLLSLITFGVLPIVIRSGARHAAAVTERGDETALKDILVKAFGGDNANKIADSSYIKNAVACAKASSAAIAICKSLDKAFAVEDGGASESSADAGGTAKSQKPPMKASAMFIKYAFSTAEDLDDLAGKTADAADADALLTILNEKLAGEATQKFKLNGGDDQSEGEGLGKLKSEIASFIKLISASSKLAEALSPEDMRKKAAAEVLGGAAWAQKAGKKDAEEYYATVASRDGGKSAKRLNGGVKEIADIINSLLGEDGVFVGKIAYATSQSDAIVKSDDSTDLTNAFKSAIAEFVRTAVETHLRGGKELKDFRAIAAPAKIGELLAMLGLVVIGGEDGLSGDADLSKTSGLKRIGGKVAVLLSRYVEILKTAKVDEEKTLGQLIEDKISAAKKGAEDAAGVARGTFIEATAVQEAEVSREEPQEKEQAGQDDD